MFQLFLEQTYLSHIMIFLDFGGAIVIQLHAKLCGIFSEFSVDSRNR